jgi:hypothetical protein
MITNYGCSTSPERFASDRIGYPKGTEGSMLIPS